jgi:3-hydroxy-9,10-secoandrosta-1,3,5(10)-triene-9,17-dione monooxygenase
LQVFYRGLTNANIGALQALLDEYAVYAPKKTSPFGGMVADPDAQFAGGLAFNAIHEIKTLLHADMDRLMAWAARGEMPSMQERLAARYRAAEVAERCVGAAKAIFEASGGSVLFDASPMGRIYRNLIAARQHVGVQHRQLARSLGAHVFGQPSADVML